jgi:hypothetical protein
METLDEGNKISLLIFRLMKHRETIIIFILFIPQGIRSLDELDVFFQYLHDVGASHSRFSGFNADLFWVRLNFCVALHAKFNFNNMPVRKEWNP